MLFDDARGLLQLLQLLRDFFVLFTKKILEKENALHFYGDVIFCLFISLVLLSSSFFLLSYFNKNVKETKFFENKFLWLVLFIKFRFLLFLFKYRGFSDWILSLFSDSILSLIIGIFKNWQSPFSSKIYFCPPKFRRKGSKIPQNRIFWIFEKFCH